METIGTYNGWANYETWNVALWINNDEGLMRLAEEYMEEEPAGTYRGFIEYIGLEKEMTPDEIPWLYFRIDEEELDTMMKDFAK